MPTNAAPLHFTQAIDFYRDKLNLPTKTWKDIWQGMHARAFVIAGATQQDLLTDFRTSIDKAISQGTTLAEFRKDFDTIVSKHGWSYKGSRGWRTRVIYETNIRQAYNAGREKQINDPALRKLRPYGLYKHGDSINPRPEHLAWDDTVLPLDDPWWQTHTPMNGWGCKCKKFTLSAKDVERRGLTIHDSAPDNGSYDWTDKTTGEVHRVPKGIDPGFAYNVGDAAWGRPLSSKVMNQWQAQKGKAWQPLTYGAPETYNRPERIPLDTSTTKLGKRLKTQEQMEAILVATLNGKQEQVFTVGGLPMLVNARSLASHVDINRSEYLPLLKEVLNDPFEVWLSFEQHKGTGKVVLRTRVIKAFQFDDKGRGGMVIANAVRGMLEGWTFIPTSKTNYLNNQRRGTLLYGRE